MTAFRLNPLLVEAMAFEIEHANGFILRHLSKSTDTSTQMMKALEQSLEITLEGIPMPNIVKEIKTLGFNRVQILMAPKEIYDVSDWDVITQYKKSIMNLLIEAKGMI